MFNLFAPIASIALILPPAGQAPVVTTAPDAGATLALVGEKVSDTTRQQSAAGPVFKQPEDDRRQTGVSSIDPLSAFRGDQVAHQVRIERRVTIRISPRRPGRSNALAAQFPARADSTRYREREMEDCLPVADIGGVQTGSGNRLLLFLKDRRIVTLGLERACRARDFYSGFYVERREDGQLCVQRDKLHSRSGAKCEVERMRQLVAAEE